MSITTDRARGRSETDHSSSLTALGSPWECSKKSRSLQLTRFVVAWFLCLLIMEASGLIFVRSGVALDFQAFYASAYQLRTHPSQMYDLALQAKTQHAITSTNFFLPFYHPSFESLIFVPFSALNFRVAYSAFLAFNMILVSAIFFTGRERVFSDPIWWGRRPELVLFLFFPLLLTLALGQDSILSLLLYCLVWRDLASGKELRAGCILGLALYKFQLAIPIAILLAIRLGWRFARGFLVTLSGVGLLSTVIVGWAGSLHYVRVLLGAASAVDQGAIAQQTINVFPAAMPNVAGLLYACGGRFLRPPITFHLLAGLCALGLFLWCARVIRRCELNVSISIAILCGLLVNYHFYFYDLTLALLPMALLAGKAHRYVSIVLFCLPALLFIVGMNWYFLMALPLLTMLLFATISAPQSAVLIPDFRAALNANG